jgi:hypothetical protein
MLSHDICKIFPAMDDEEFRALADDIVKHGLREPIWLYEGLILDGRHRYRVCEEFGIEPKFREYEGGDPVGFVVSMNLRRRHLTESQRAAVAAEIANLGEGRPPTKKETPPIGGVSQAKAAEMLNVGTKSVERAKKVITKGTPKLIEAVRSGEVHVSAAAEIVDLSPAEQDKAVEAGTVPRAAKDIRQGKSRGRTRARVSITSDDEIVIEFGKGYEFTLSRDSARKLADKLIKAVAAATLAAEGGRP